MKTLYFFLLTMILISLLVASCAVNEISRPEFDDDEVEWSTPFQNKTMKRNPAFFKKQSRNSHMRRVMERN